MNTPKNAPKYKLTLTDADSVVVESWTLSADGADKDADFSLPVRSYASALLATEINTAIQRYEITGPATLQPF